MSSARIDGSKIDQLLAEAVDRGAVPHVAAIAATRDGIIYEGAAGVQIAGENDTPVGTSTQFRIMSMTKMIATTHGAAADGTGHPRSGRARRAVLSTVR